jgi:hypothetical protein
MFSSRLLISAQRGHHRGAGAFPADPVHGVVGGKFFA